MRVVSLAAIVPWSFWLLAGAPALAAQAMPAVPSPPIHAARLDAAIVVDGLLTEPVWQGAEPVAGFHQLNPVEGAAPSQRTEVRVAYDDHALYVAARMFDTAPDSILARLARRDVTVTADNFAVYLDPFHDRRSGYYFIINAAGTLYDGTLANDGWTDDSWDGVWQGKAHRDAQGWTAELRIPYSQLRFEKRRSYVWGIDFRRVIARHNEEDYVVSQPKNGSGFVSRFPDLVGIENVRGAGTVELVPYMTTKAAYQPHARGDPFHDGSDYRPGGGGDLRMAVGSRLTLNATVNPDFGQVEVDPAVVNLSDVETQFQEKRPFFVEGISNFRFGNEGANNYWGFNWGEPTFFYSRRIGRAPQGTVPDSTYSDVPLGTTILGAGKLTGKLGPTVNIGTLHAVTQREYARLWGQGGARAEVEPLTYYGVTRVLKEFPGRRAGLGLLNTTVARRFQDGRLRDELNSGSYLGGVDGWIFLDRDRNWVISGWSALSQARGDAARITALQRTSRRYFQRPDARSFAVDPSATVLNGWGSRYYLNKQNGRTFFNAALGALSPGFEINDLGYQSRADYVNGHVGWGRKWTEPTRHRKYQELIFAGFASRDFDGNFVNGGSYTGGYTQFANNWGWNYQVMYFPPTVNNRRTRGGPLTLNRAAYETSHHLETDGARPVRFILDAELERWPGTNSTSWSAYPVAEWKPASNMLVSAGPGYARVSEDAQYVATVTDPAATATFGKRYLFARLESHEVSANLRLNWAFSPKLSLQVYLQPLLSAGDYRGYKELARRRSYDFTRDAVAAEAADSVRIDPDGAGPLAGFAVAAPDFNYVSLRGNAVFRWEFLPGSALYVVWTQTREDETVDGAFAPGRALDEMFATRGENIFLAKVTYYLGL